MDYTSLALLFLPVSFSSWKIINLLNLFKIQDNFFIFQIKAQS